MKIPRADIINYTNAAATVPANGWITCRATPLIRTGNQEDREGIAVRALDGRIVSVTIRLNQLAGIKDSHLCICYRCHYTLPSCSSGELILAIYCDEPREGAPANYSGAPPSTSSVILIICLLRRTSHGIFRIRANPSGLSLPCLCLSSSVIIQTEWTSVQDFILLRTSWGRQLSVSSKKGSSDRVHTCRMSHFCCVSTPVTRFAIAS